jgi:DNA-binding NtrC family response regulator
MKSIQILVIEEDAEQLAWIVGHLKALEYDVFYAHSGDEAFHFLFQNPVVHMIIMSSGLKDIPAVDLLTKIEDAIGCPHTIVLGKSLTGETAVELMKAGASDIIQVPFHEMELQVAVKQACETQSLIEQVNREKDRNVDNEIGRRLTAFSEFLEGKRKRGTTMTLGELKLFFPAVESDPYIETDELVKLLESESYHEALMRHPKPVVLTVDDELGVCRLMVKLLSPHFTVLKAHDGQQAYDIIKAKNPVVDMVLLDIGMPGLPGDKWVSNFRDLDPRLSVAMLTAYKEDIDLIVLSMRAGATDYLTKPFDPDLLVEKIKRMIAQKQFNHVLGTWMQTPHFRLKGSAFQNPM